MKQQIQYCTTSDGVRIAFAATGEGTPIIRTSLWLTHLQHDFTEPVWRHVMLGLARHHLFVRYDPRGEGMSQREVAEISFEAWMKDLEAVADASGPGALRPVRLLAGRRDRDRLCGQAPDAGEPSDPLWRLRARPSEARRRSGGGPQGDRSRQGADPPGLGPEARRAPPMVHLDLPPRGLGRPVSLVQPAAEDQLVARRRRPPRRDGGRARRIGVAGEGEGAHPRPPLPRRRGRPVRGRRGAGRLDPRRAARPARRREPPVPARFPGPSRLHPRRLRVPRRSAAASATCPAPGASGSGSTTASDRPSRTG